MDIPGFGGAGLSVVVRPFRLLAPQIHFQTLASVTASTFVRFGATPNLLDLAALYELRKKIAHVMVPHLLLSESDRYI